MKSFSARTSLSMPSHPPENPPSVGARLVDARGRELPLREVSVRATAGAGVARVVLQQRFVNDGAEPLNVSYQVPLPADGAVAGYAFTIGERRIVGEVDSRAAARERFEDALMDGRSASLLEQERSSLFELELGNIPAGAAIETAVTVDQPLQWLEEGAWEWRFPTVVAPRYQGAPGRVRDSARQTALVLDGDAPARALLELRITDALSAAPFAPAHALMSSGGEAGSPTEVRLREDCGAALDRDLVVRWPVARLEPGLTLLQGRPPVGHPREDTAFGLLTLVPPNRDSNIAPVPRDLIVLLDTSGSMGGAPLDQARRVVSALIRTLRPADRLELIEFSTRPSRWRRGPEHATAGNKRDALKWVAGLRASGATEMRTGILEALTSLRPGAQRQVLLVTDGLIGFEHEIVAAIRERLPASCRVHTLGVGHGVNRSLTGPAARAGAGLELVVAPGEDVEPIVGRLLARTNAPLVVDLELSGSALRAHAPAKLPDLFAAAPVTVGLALSPRGGELLVRGRTADGAFERSLRVQATAPDDGSDVAAALFARESVEDLELACAAGGDVAPLEARIERLGLEFQISTRLTSWVAISRSADVDATEPTRSVRMPHALARGLSAEGVGLRGPSPAPGPASFGLSVQKTMASAPMAAPPPPTARPDMTRRRRGPDATRRPTGVLKSMKRKGSELLGGLFRERSSKFDAEYAPEPKSKSMAKAEVSKPAVFQRGWTGRIRKLTDDRLVVSATAAVRLRWEPPATVEIELADGTRVAAEVDSRRTTAEGWIAVGRSVRLVLRLPVALADAPVRLVVGETVIEL